MAGEQRLPGGGGGCSSSKLRLKRKKPAEPAACSQAGLPPPARTEGSSSGWFEAQGLNEADRTWLALLKAAGPQMSRSNLDNVARLPEFLTKSSQTTSPQPKPETFNVGLEPFQWEPFPLYHRDVKMIDHRIHQNSETPTTGVVEQKINKDEQSKPVSPIPEEKPLIADEYTAEGSKTRHGTGHSSKDWGKKVKKSPRALRQNSPRSFAPAALQQKFGLRELWGKTSTQSEQKRMRESGKERASYDTLTQNRTTSLLPSQGRPVTSSLGGLQQKPGCQNEDISSLDRCPMCQIHFTGTLSQLDRDSHLAKCLSESTEDVIW